MRFAVLTSLVFHLLLLWPALPRLPDKEALPLQATLRPSPPVPVAPAASLPSRTVVPAPSVGDTSASSAGGITIAPRPPVLATRAFDAPQSAPVPQPTAIAPDPAPPPAPGPVLPALATAAASPSGALLTQGNASGEVLNGLRGYRLSVASQARRNKRYPPQAMAAGWAGTAEVRLEVGSDGRPRAATVGHSSGYESLDRAALAMIDAGAQRAPLPESLHGKSFAVVLPVVFSLEDE